MDGLTLFTINIICYIMAPIGFFCLGWIARDYFNSAMQTVAKDVKQLADTIFADSAAKTAKLENNN